MDTHFAPAPRAPDNELASEIRIVSGNPVVSGLLASVSGLLAIIDSHRQIVALNDSFMRMIGIENPALALGLRPGEALDCVHAHDEPAGCGTTEFCSTCGAAIAIVASLGENRPVQRLCALTTEKDGKEIEMALSVRSQPIEIDGKKLLLLFLGDVTKRQKLASLERVFFHDVSNMVGMLLVASDLLLDESSSDAAQTVKNASERLAREVSIQRMLHHSESADYQPVMHSFKIEDAIHELKAFFDNHPAARGRNISCSQDIPDISVTTDFSLLLRVLCNMVINALEATPEGGMIKVWVEKQTNGCAFCVWNRQAIPEDIQKRIFQRNFTTKEQPGRGIGTYSMRLLGEELLGGKVSFTSSEAEGTTFMFSCPASKPSGNPEGEH